MLLPITGMAWLIRGVLILGMAALAWSYRAAAIAAIPPEVLGLSPHEHHALVIRARGLHDTPTGRAWRHAADAALEEPREVRAPFTSSGDIGIAAAGAMAWRFPVRRGQRLIVHAQFAAGESFLDLIDEDGHAVASGTASRAPLVYDVGRDRDLLLRLQPEFQRSGPFTLTQVARASLDFPVQDTSSRAIQSVFGDGRDDGRRRHEGVDIFAARGTPAVAAVDGFVVGATSNRLGGNVVWLWSPSRSITLYYAHLDRHAVSPGTRVRAGEVVGYVGNTGNARSTAPHLHFGVYARPDGAVDPVPFIVDPVRGERLMHPDHRSGKGPQ
jgi:murein DD-endopeptidase MepM/ murein hydrolase activator NlpD